MTSYVHQIQCLSQRLEENRTWCSNYEHLLQGALGLPIIGHALTTAPSQHSDIVFVSVDFENANQIISRAGSDSMAKAQAGISIFDTRDLSSTSSQGLLRTYNIGLGGSPSTKKRVDRRFHFGKTIWIHGLADLRDSIEKLIDRTRNIVLVVHGSGADIRALWSLKFDLETSVVGVLNTELLARAIGVPEVRGALRLKNILESLGCPVEGCHVAGNDANFTLRILLLLTVEYYAVLDEPLNDDTWDRLEKIREIGLSPLKRLLPPTKGTHIADESEGESS